MSLLLHMETLPARGGMGRAAWADALDLAGVAAAKVIQGVETCDACDAGY
jgi:hypothetical protein